MRTKKGALAFKHSAPTPVLAEQLALDPLVDNVSRLLQKFGFRQMIAPPVEEGKYFKPDSHPVLEAMNLNASLGRDLVLPPTHMFGIYKQYRQAMKDRIPAVAKWFYVLPVARNQSGRMNMEHEIGVFLFGENSSMAYAQLINTLTQVFSGLGCDGLVTEITSRGCLACQREYREILKDHFEGGLNSPCDRCAVNLSRNLSAIFSCANESCQELMSGAPHMIDFLDEPCRATLVDALEIIDSLEVPYVLNPVVANHLVLEKIVFALQSSLGTVGRGGDYTKFYADNFSGEPTPVLGFLTTLEDVGRHIPEDRRGPVGKTEVFVLSLGSAASRRALSLYRDLHNAGISVAEAMLGSQGIKTQLKEATDHHAEIALIIGQKEAQEETVILRDIRSGMQEVFMGERIIEEVRKRLGK